MVALKPQMGSLPTHGRYPHLDHPIIAATYRHRSSERDSARRPQPSTRLIRRCEARDLSRNRVSTDGLTIAVTASAAALGNAFDTSFQSVRLRSGRVAYANTSAPALLATVSDSVYGVVGLDSLSLPEPQSCYGASQSTRGRPSPTHPGEGSSPSRTGSDGGPTNSCVSEGTGSYWNADQIASAYGFGAYYQAGDEGAGQTIALSNWSRTRAATSAST